jgi:hypothetical protein
MVAAHTVASMMRDAQASRQLRTLYAELSYTFAMAHHTNDEVLRWYQAQLRTALGGLTLLVRDAHDPVPGAEKAASEPDDVREARRIDALLRELGDQDLQHRGSGYRIARAPAKALAHRSTLEVLGDAEARRVLGELAREPTRSPAQRKALQELAASLDKRKPIAALQLLVLRRNRVFVQAEGQATLTPSQLRERREKHWIEIRIEDSEGNALSDTECEVTLPDGSKVTKLSNDLGFIRIDDVSAAGSCSVSLPKLDAKLWATA